MALKDFLRRNLPKSFLGVTVEHTPPPEMVYAVPILGRKFTTTGEVPKENYLFYAYLYADSPEAAVAVVRKKVRDEGYEFIEQAGKVLMTELGDWDSFAAAKFDWIRNDLPTGAQMKDSPRDVIHYSPKIIRI